MKTTNFDAIAAASPLDAQASVIRDGSGDLWEAKIPDYVKRWAGPPEMLPADKIPDADRWLVGHRNGRLVAVGVWLHGNPKKNATWVCRCDCGYYEGFKARALRAEHSSPLCCHACQRVEVLRKRSSQKNTRAARKASAAYLDKLARSA